MARSPGFGSDPSNFTPDQDPRSRPFRTRFRCAYTYRLKLAAKTNSLTHYTKGTPSLDARNQGPGISWPLIPDTWLRLLVGIRFQELFHPAHRGAFHLSLTVLVHYRSLRST